VNSLKQCAGQGIALKTNKTGFIKTINSHWIYKILAAFLCVILIAGTIHALAMNFSIDAAFERHLGRMSENMQNMMGASGNNSRGVNLYTSFRAAVNETLWISALAAFIIAGLAALLISRRITKPIKTLTDASQQIAQGEYNHRIPENEIPNDELGQLAHSFNQMAEKLEGIDAMRRQLIGDISHELRTPLTAIKGSMEALMDGVLPSDQATYQQIYREADRLQRLVEDLQELNRVDGNTFPLNLKLVHVSELVKSALTPLENTFTMKGVTLESQVESGLPAIRMDSDRIQQVLHNLLGNALQFTPPDGSVRLSVKKAENTILFSVRDSGIGISSEHLPHIFERFYRADKSRSRTNGGGSGIGLTIAKSLVEAHGGEIWVESAGENQGSTFSFTIPL
jgi:signal transduction histidine kinase